MSKAKHVLWMVALVAALAAPISWASDGSADPGFFQQLMAQVIQAIIGPEPAAELTPPGQNPELGELVPVGGAALTQPGQNPELGELVPVNG